LENNFAEHEGGERGRLGAKRGKWYGKGGGALDEHGILSVPAGGTEETSSHRTKK